MPVSPISCVEHRENPEAGGDPLYESALGYSRNMVQKGSPQRPLNVMVTGATGFVGLHSTCVLRSAGHHVRALVRSPDKAERVFGSAGIVDVAIVRGDITDERSVGEALEGCDAVVHSAAMVSVLARDSTRVRETNLRGVELVVGGALERGVERVVHVSSMTALFRPNAGRIDERSPLGVASSGYGASKIECEKYVRDLQEAGAPIQVTYPGAVIGPDDPGLSEAVAGLKAMVENRFVSITTSGMQLIDVRDVAEAHRRLLERGGPPDRFLMGGHYLTWSELADALEEVTGRRFLRLPVPAVGVRIFGTLVDLLSRFTPIAAPITLEAADYATDWAVSDDRHLKETLDLEYRDVRVSLRDTIDWLRDSGQLGSRFGL